MTRAGSLGKTQTVLELPQRTRHAIPLDRFR